MDLYSIPDNLPSALLLQPLNLRLSGLHNTSCVLIAKENHSKTVGSKSRNRGGRGKKYHGKQAKALSERSRRPPSSVLAKIANSPSLGILDDQRWFEPKFSVISQASTMK